MAGGALAMRLALGTLLGMRATVYTRGTGGAFDVTDKTGLRCLIQSVEQTDNSAPGRAQFARRDVLYWDYSYTMPEHCRITVDSRSGVSWQVVAGTQEPDLGPGGTVVMWHADLTEARS